MRSMLTAMTVLLSAALFAADVPQYQALRAAAPDGRVISVQNLTLERDAYRFEFRSGAFHLLTPVDGTTFGAVFIGDGSYRLLPATKSEVQQLRLVRGDERLETLTDQFDSLVLLFTDGTAAELEKHAAAVTGAPDPKARSLYEEHVKLQRQKYRVNLHLRILSDLLNRPARTDGTFIAAVDGKAFEPALLTVDPLGVAALGAKYNFFGGEETAFLSFDDQNGGFWYLSTLKGTARDGHGREPVALADGLHYAIDTRVEGLRISATTRIRLMPSAGLRVLPLLIQPKLRIDKATSGGAELGIVQEPMETSRLRRIFFDEFTDADAAVVFSSPLAAGQPVEIELTYEGEDVLASSGPDMFSVRARESWYPNLGAFTDLATYELTFRCPKSKQVISVGTLVEDKVEGKERITRWKSDVPIRVAGFNYGNFEKISTVDAPTGVTINVYTTDEWSKKAKDTMIDAQNAVRTGTAFFGPVPHKTISVTQQLESFGQSWPSLIYFPTVALTTGVERAMGFGDLRPDTLHDLNEFVKTVGWHEVAHQWWGHRIGWATYRDQWLSEGFSEFSSALTLQFTESVKAHDAFWQNRREEILEKRSSVANWRAGAMTQGYRSSTRHSPGAARAMIYAKGGYVVHMLRMLMRDDGRKNPDEQFMAMMQDFLTTYDQQNPSTEDFQRIVEQHLTPLLDANRNRSMDYFFKQWVYGTEIPRLKATLTAAASTDGKYKITGSVTQDQVSDNFVTMVPIYGEFGDKKILVRLAIVRVVGNKSEPVQMEMPLPYAPKRLLINARHDVLTRD